MTEFLRRVFEKGKITIPKELRDLHGLEEGDYIKLRVVEIIKNGHRVDATANGHAAAAADAEVDGRESK